MRERSKRVSRTHLFALLLLLAIAALVAESDPSLEDPRQLAQARAVESTSLGSGDTQEILQRIGALHLGPGSISMGDTESSLPGESQQLSLDPISRDRITEALGIDAKWLVRGVPIAALHIDPRDFEELHANPFARGREWEKPAFLAFLNQDELLLTTRVGLRIHGNWSRSERHRRSYRLHFRGRYGLARVPAYLFPTPGSRSPRVLVLRRDHSLQSDRGEWPFVAPLAADISSRIGAPIPRTLPVVLYINGEYLGIFHLTERIDRDHLLSHFGHDDFVLARTEHLTRFGEAPDQSRPVSVAERVRLGPVESYREFRTWSRNSAGLGFDAINDRIDVHSLSTWLLATLFCSNQDPFQGALLLDQRHPDRGWFWMLWDLDASFRRSVLRPVTLDWMLSASTPNVREDERVWLLKSLLESPEYRGLLAELFIETMNHRTTIGFIDQVIHHYEDMADRFETRRDHFDRIRAFLRSQRYKIEKEFQTMLHRGPVHRVQVEGPEQIQILIDGYLSAPGYNGRYFQGMTIDLDIPRTHRGIFSHWRVEGRKIRSHTLRLPVDGDLRIVAKLKPTVGSTGS